MIGPRVGGLAVRDLHAIPGFVSGDGRAVGLRSRPGHVQRRVRWLAELGAGDRRRVGLPRLEVHDADGDLGFGLLALHAPRHASQVGGRGLVVQGRALLHADLPAARVDDERARRGARQRVAERLLRVGRPGDGIAHRSARGRVLVDVASQLAPGQAGRDAGDVEVHGDVAAVPVADPVGDGGRGRVENLHLQVGGIAALDRHPERAGVRCGRRVGQRVAVVIDEVAADRPKRGRVAPAEGEEETGVARRCEPRRPVGPAFSDVRPGAGTFLARERAHLRLVGRAGLQVGQAEARRRGAQRAAVRRPLGGFFTCGRLLAVLHVIARDGQAVGGGRRPGHVQPRVGRLAERGPCHRRRGGLTGFEVRDADGHVRGGRLPLHGPIDLARVGALGLEVQAGALLDADLAGGAVDDERPGGRRLARQRVGQRIVGLVVAVVEGRPGHRIPHRRAGGGVLGHASAQVRAVESVGGAADVDVLRGVAAVAV